ncbi:hypothetical protein EYF80_006544 [Liparis tanakae]|uniref:Uncharacterized protein n=1 Tax=Liparis tanakae TaxID=230148 RepID=A0A4Z2IZT4_9TELE|nr:hypothetical protein EYF80_006544 [Liparis tanakae]
MSTGDREQLQEKESNSTSPLTRQLSSQQDDSYILRRDVHAPARRRRLVSAAIKQCIVEKKENKPREHAAVWTPQQAGTLHCSVSFLGSWTGHSLLPQPDEANVLLPRSSACRGLLCTVLTPVHRAGLQ